MTAEGIKSREVLDELESHLRDDVEQQARAGAATEKAFQEAVRRIGTSDKVRVEFAKVTAPATAVNLKFLRVCCLALAAFVILVESWTLFAFEISPLERILGITFVVSIAGYIGALPYLNRTWFPGVRGWTLRNALGTVCNLGALLWILLALSSALGVVRWHAGIIFEVAGWSLLSAATATVFVFALRTDNEALRLWSPAVKQCFDAAEKEALRFHHDFIGTEHVLLGLLENDGIVSKVLGKMGVSRDIVRADIEKIVGAGQQLRSSRQATPVCTPRMKKTIRLAMKEARTLERERVDAEHLFLGLLLEGGGVAAVILQKQGVSPDRARREILDELRFA
ncbi:MAG TPA: Clp protease N-terminal domain-containing protein [Verrucomicrobiae bacterium]|nr:Clp protease N-terminal domain-containing protein [Verrucomicrobiae bacterium]